jgi:uncharacterized protein
VPNALAQETSPYLLQHRDNPVDWLPWGETALARAREQDRPLLVSIGYSACHWCHVMERECFEDERIAGLMNERFVCVKVDREERPDVDALYMEAVQAMTGQGGWPLNVFLTPEQVPFFGGTYFPPEARMGMPSWPQVLQSVSEAWDERRDEIRESGERIVDHLRGAALLEPSTAPIAADALDEAVEHLSTDFDSRHGGFGAAPKFPPASAIEFLLGRAAVAAGTDADRTETLEARMALSTLRAMARGGIFDQVGGGFARYAVDGTWTVPHFEKMLYDNALLARAYLHGWQLSGEQRLLRTARETLDWALREMRAPEGGFYAALDADSEGVEGRYYVWTVAELREVLGEDADAAIAYFGATERGNFDGANVLEARGEEPAPALRESIRTRLLAAREQRVRPGLDDKRLTAWNALMIAALADAGAVLSATEDEQLRSEGVRYLEAASGAASFVLDRLRDADGRLLRSFNGDTAHLAAYLEDHAFMLEALLALYQATFDERWFVEARALADTILERFGDAELGGFFSTASDHEALVARRKDLQDHPIPAGSSSAALGLLALAALTGEHSYEREAERALALSHELAVRHPTAFGHLLQALAFHTARVREVALVGEDLDPLVAVLRSRLRPAVVLAGASASGAHESVVPLLEGREPVGGLAAAYVCERFSCRRPVTEPAELAALL